MTMPGDMPGAFLGYPPPTVAEYERWLATMDDPDILRAEAVERMRVNVGLIRENDELKRRIRQFEEGPKESTAADKHIWIEISSPETLPDRIWMCNAHPGEERRQPQWLPAPGFADPPDKER